MKSILLSIGACLALGTKIQKHKVPTKSTHFDETLVYPEALAEILEAYCGNYDEWASNLIETYGGDDQQLNLSEFGDVLNSYEELSGLEEDLQQLLFDEVANNDGGVSKEDLVQYANEVSSAAGIDCEDDGQNLAQILTQAAKKCVCYWRLCLCYGK